MRQYLRKKIIRDVRNRLCEFVDDYEIRAELAMGVMYRMKCPLSFADASLDDTIRQYLDEYIEEEELNIDSFEEFFELDEFL